MSKSIRFALRDQQGVPLIKYNSPLITSAKSVVHITAGEIWFTRGNEPPQTGAPFQDFHYHVGDASIWVSNISPRDGGVDFLLHVDWSSPLPVGVTITVEDDFPVEIQV